MTRIFDHESLYLKAKLFLNLAMDQDERSFDEQALWASMALELMGKAALSRVSPLLIADPVEGGSNLLVAAGLVDGEPQFVSIGAKTVYTRCGRVFRPFSEQEALKISRARNGYVHGGIPTFTAIPPDAWWPRYWSLAVVLINALELDVEDVVGAQRAAVVERHLARNKQNIKHRTEVLIERARLRLAQHEAGSLPARVAGLWTPGIARSANMTYSERAECPACAELGEIEGDVVENTDVQWDGDEGESYDVTVTLTVLAEYFNCSSCGLTLDGADFIAEAGLPIEIETIGDESDLPDYEPDYGND